jgi:hypothetical protein
MARHGAAGRACSQSCSSLCARAHSLALLLLTACSCCLLLLLLLLLLLQAVQPSQEAQRCLGQRPEKGCPALRH